MTKKLLALLAASLLLLSLAACKNNDTDKDTDTLSPYDESEDDHDTETDKHGNVVTDTDTDTETETTRVDDVNPSFTNKSLKVITVASQGYIRKAADFSGDSIFDTAFEGDELTVTGEGGGWYRIAYGENTCYIRKSLVAPASLVDGFTAVSDTVTVKTAANIRSFPLVDDIQDEYIIRTSVPAGTVLERVATNGTWSRVKFTVTVENEGGTQEEVKEYYVSNSCLTIPETETAEAQS